MVNAGDKKKKCDRGWFDIPYIHTVIEFHQILIFIKNTYLYRKQKSLQWKKCLVWKIFIVSDIIDETQAVAAGHHFQLKRLSFADLNITERKFDINYTYMMPQAKILKTFREKKRKYFIIYSMKTICTYSYMDRTKRIHYFLCAHTNTRREHNKKKRSKVKIIKRKEKKTEKLP